MRTKLVLLEVSIKGKLVRLEQACQVKLNLVTLLESINGNAVRLLQPNQV